MGAAIGVLIAVALLTPMSPPTWLRYILYFINAMIGFFIFNGKKGLYIKASTALVGSFMFFYGLNMIVTKHTHYNLSL